MPDVQEVFRTATQKVRPDPGALERQNRTQRRRSLTQRVGGYAVIAILAIAAVLIAVFATGQREERPAGQREEEPSTAGATGSFFFLDLETGEATPLPDSLAGGERYVASPDGTRLAYNPHGCSVPNGAVTVANSDGTGVRTIEPPEGGALCAPQWSPDGTRLVYQERPDATGLSVGNLFVHDLSSGRRTQVSDLELTKASWWWLAPSFSEDGQSVLFHLPRSASSETKWDVWSVPVTGGDPTLVLRDAAFAMDVPAGGPEGSTIAFLQPRPNIPTGERVMLGRPIGDSEFRETLVEAKDEIYWPTVSPDGTRIAYQDGGYSIYVVEIETGEASTVARAGAAEWLDNDTLIVEP
jgi:Tol biopolymer transport system component